MYDSRAGQNPEEHQLSQLHRSSHMEHTNNSANDSDGSRDHQDDRTRFQEDSVNQRVVRKLDFILLPFLCLLFLVNSLDRSNIGNAETANFTKDAGLQPEDLNTAVAVFFAFFVALQPVGAACGRRFGMVRWVPSVMFIWGICTCLHVWVKALWQLIILRIIIGILEAGFYPTTVAYLSLFYTRYEFARRLGVFYGQYALAGALGGVLAYAVFSAFPSDGSYSIPGAWKSWQVLFLLEGGLTIVIAAAGFLWLPESADTAWFFTQEERKWASLRISKDRMEAAHSLTGHYASSSRAPAQPATTVDNEEGDAASRGDEGEEAQGLLGATATKTATPSDDKSHYTGATGLKTYDIVAAVTDWKVYYLLILNILSAIPAAAFTVFLPLVISGFGVPAAYANLLTAPLFVAGAVVLGVAVWYSDRTHQRIVPILYGLGALVAGLAATVLLAHAHAPVGPRYAALCLLLGGSFVASPLTIAWFAGNIEEPGKRSIVLGINGWGNLSGVFSALLFADRFKPGYEVPFFVTLAFVAIAFVGYLVFRAVLVRENARRAEVLRGWEAEEIEAERRWGKGPLPFAGARAWALRFVRRRWGLGGFEEGRVGEEKLTYSYGL